LKTSVGTGTSWSLGGNTTLIDAYSVVVCVSDEFNVEIFTVQNKENFVLRH